MCPFCNNEFCHNECFGDDGTTVDYHPPNGYKDGWMWCPKHRKHYNISNPLLTLVWNELLNVAAPAWRQPRPETLDKGEHE